VEWAAEPEPEPELELELALEPPEPLDSVRWWFAAAAGRFEAAVEDAPLPPGKSQVNQKEPATRGQTNKEVCATAPSKERGNRV
jgi:hypothetical protein